MILDYIIVGFGLSGMSFIEELDNQGKSYKVYDDFSQKSSRAAGGLYNPVILKRFTLAWQAKEQMDVALPFYKGIEAKLQQEIIKELPVLRRFNAAEEQNNWFEACDRPHLGGFLSSELIKNVNPALDAPFQYGKVQHTGKIDIGVMLSYYLKYLQQRNAFSNESFDHMDMIIEKDHINYKGQKCRHVVFAEGFGLKHNPLFNYLPLIGNKGEYIIIKSKDLKLQEAVKSSVFIIPLGGDMYKVGATYNHEDKSADTTLTAREELQKKLEKFLKVPYQIIDQVSGIRPTVIDRRPLVGTHAKYNNIHVLNGLGTRGILIAPTIAKQLYAYIEKGEALNKEIDIRRFRGL